MVTENAECRMQNAEPGSRAAPWSAPLVGALLRGGLAPLRGLPLTFEG